MIGLFSFRTRWRSQRETLGELPGLSSPPQPVFQGLENGSVWLLLGQRQRFVRPRFFGFVGGAGSVCTPAAERTLREVAQVSARSKGLPERPARLGLRPAASPGSLLSGLSVTCYVG